MDAWIKSGVPKKPYSPDSKIASALWEVDFADRVMFGGPEKILQVSQNDLLREPCWDHFPVPDPPEMKISQDCLSLHTQIINVYA